MLYLCAKEWEVDREEKHEIYIAIECSNSDTNFFVNRHGAFGCSRVSAFVPFRNCAHIDFAGSRGVGNDIWWDRGCSASGCTADIWLHGNQTSNRNEASEMKKQVANMITGTRVIMAGYILILGNSFSKIFMIIYLLCGLSDLIDGPIARLTKSVSIKGAQLDTAGDVLLYMALCKRLIWQGLLPIWFIICFGSTLILSLIHI